VQHVVQQQQQQQQQQHNERSYRAWIHVFILALQRPSHTL
jgi:hypothetical protein